MRSLFQRRRYRHRAERVVGHEQEAQPVVEAIFADAFVGGDLVRQHGGRGGRVSDEQESGERETHGALWRATRPRAAGDERIAQVIVEDVIAQLGRAPFAVLRAELLKRLPADVRDAVVEYPEDLDLDI